MTGRDCAGVSSLATNRYTGDLSGTSGHESSEIARSCALNHRAEGCDGRRGSQYGWSRPIVTAATLEGMQIDHVTVAGSDLDLLRRAFAACGLESVYGGPHANGVTHMASIGFRDGSYIELISSLHQPGCSRFWPEMIAGNAGVCAWCVGVGDLAAESARLRKLDIPVDGPAAYSRQRPDGRKVEWDLSFAGEGSPGSLLPFFIQDRTPRSLRSEPSPELATSSLAGIGLILIAVSDLPAAVTLFRRIWEWDAPQIQYDPWLQGEVACFSRNALALVQAAGGDLLHRTERWGDLPAALGLATENFETSCRQVPVEAVSQWRFGDGVRHVAWFRPPAAPFVWLALVSDSYGSGIAQA